MKIWLVGSWPEDALNNMVIFSSYGEAKKWAITWGYKVYSLEITIDASSIKLERDYAYPIRSDKS